MYSVTNDYLTEMMTRSTRRRLVGTIGTVPFNQDDVIQGTFEVSNRAAESSDMKIGGVYIGELSMVLKPSFLNKIARDQYQDKDVSVSIGLYVGNAWVDVPVGVYTLQAPKISKRGIALTGYDYMKKLDKPFNPSITGGLIYDLLYLIARDCGVTLGMTPEEVAALPNGQNNIGIYEENDIETYRDLLYWVAQATGRFATFDRYGHLVLRKFGVPNDVVLDEMHRDTDVEFSGYVTKWTGINIVDMEKKVTKYYGLEVDDGLTMNLGSNPLLQYGLPAVVDNMRMAVLNEIAEIQYTPYSCQSARDPIYDLGDEINFEGGISGDCTGVVMAYTFNLDNYDFEGYGDDPALSNNRSKTDKNISGLLSQVDSNSLTYYYFENAQELYLGENTDVVIADFKFASKVQTEVDIWHEFKINVEGNAEEERTTVYTEEEPEPPEEEPVITSIGYFDERKYSKNPVKAIVTYWYDGNEMGYHPIENWSEDGFHILNLNYFLRNVPNTQVHEWKVTLKLIGGTGTIAITDAHILLSGQGMVGDEDIWDGTIDVSDEIGTYSVRRLTTVELAEEVSVDIIESVFQTFADEVDTPDVKRISAAEVEESVSIVLENVVFGLMSEDGEYAILSADGNYVITTED